MSLELLSNIGWPTLLTLAVGMYLLLLGCKVPLPPKGMRGKVWVFFLSFFLLLWGSSSVMLKSNTMTPAEIIVSDIRTKFSPPVDLSDIMRLEDITAEGSNVVYHVSMSPSVQRVNKSINDLKNDLFADACNNEDFVMGLAIGLSLEIRFTQGGTKMESLIINPSDCTK